MFKAIIEAKKFKESIEAVTSIVDDARINITPDGMLIKAVDPANVAMIDLTLKATAFEEFTANKGELCIDLSRLNDLLSMSEKTETVELKVDEESHKLVISMSGLTYKILLLDPNSIRKEPKIPQLDLPASVVLSGTDLKRAVKAAEKVSDHMSMGVNGDIFYLEAEDGSDQMRLDLNRDQLISLKPGDVSSLFPLDYLLEIVKSAGKANEVTIELGKDLPVIIKFNLDYGNGEVKYFLSPRIESN